MTENEYVSIYCRIDSGIQQKPNDLQISLATLYKSSKWEPISEWQGGWALFCDKDYYPESICAGHYPDATAQCNYTHFIPLPEIPK